MRFFFAPLVLPNKAADSRCWFAWPLAGGTAFPQSMKLGPSPVTAGIYNQWEFLKILVTLARAWDVAICSYRQTSICNFVITGIAERCQAPARAAQAEAAQSAPAASSSKEEEIDPSFFDAPCMLPNANPFAGGLDSSGFGAWARFADGADDDDALGDPIPEDEDDDLLDPDVASDDDLQRLLAEAMVAEQVPVNPVPEVDADAKSESGASRASAAGGVKTPATDFEVLKNCLGHRQLNAFISMCSRKFFFHRGKH